MAICKHVHIAEKQESCTGTHDEISAYFNALKINYKGGYLSKRDGTILKRKYL